MTQKRYCTLAEFAQKHNLDLGDLLHKLVNEQIDTYVFYSGDGKWALHTEGEVQHKENYSAGLFKLSPIQLAELELTGTARLTFLIPSHDLAHQLLATSCPMVDFSVEAPSSIQYFALKEPYVIEKEALVVVLEDYSRLIEDEALKKTMDSEALLQRIAELENIPYLDTKNPYYAPELALAIDIWKRLFIKNEGNQKHGMERQVEKLLFSTLEGDISNALIKRLSSIVNPKPASFTTKN